MSTWPKRSSRIFDFFFIRAGCRFLRPGRGHEAGSESSGLGTEARSVNLPWLRDELEPPTPPTCPVGSCFLRTVNSFSSIQTQTGARPDLPACGVGLRPRRGAACGLGDLPGRRCPPDFDLLVGEVARESLLCEVEGTAGAVVWTCG